MAKSKVKKEKTPALKKEFRSHINDQLKTALNGLEGKLGKKEFESRLKRATKLLTAGIKIKPDKPPKKEEPVVESKAE